MVAETVNLTEDYNTYTLLSSLQDVDKAVDLIFEFGANGNPAPNHVMIKDFKISEIPMFDENPLAFKGNVFFHEDGSMVYYAQKLGNIDWHNKVSTVIENVEAGGEYTLTVEVEPEKRLDMVTTIPDAKNADNNGDAWYREWMGENLPTKEPWGIFASLLPAISLKQWNRLKGG